MYLFIDEKHNLKHKSASFEPYTLTNVVNVEVLWA
jgi:hypothetical protein